MHLQWPISTFHNNSGVVPVKVRNTQILACMYGEYIKGMVKLQNSIVFVFFSLFPANTVKKFMMYSFLAVGHGEIYVHDQLLVLISFVAEVNINFKLHAIILLAQRPINVRLLFSFLQTSFLSLLSFETLHTCCLQPQAHTCVTVCVFSVPGFATTD